MDNNTKKKWKILEVLYIKSRQPRINLETSDNILKCLRYRTLFIPKFLQRMDTTNFILVETVKNKLPLPLTLTLVIKRKQNDSLNIKQF